MNSEMQCSISVKIVTETLDRYLNKLALLWGEAQKKIAYCYPNVNYSGLKVTYVNLK